MEPIIQNNSEEIKTSEETTTESIPNINLGNDIKESISQIENVSKESLNEQEKQNEDIISSVPDMIISTASSENHSEIPEQETQPSVETEKKLSFAEKMKLFSAKAKEMGGKASSFKDMAINYGSKASEIAKTFSGKASETAETAKEKFEEAKEKTTETVEKAKEIKDRTAEKIEIAKEKTSDAIEKANEIKDVVTEKTSGAVEAVKEKSEEAIEKANEIKDKIENKTTEKSAMDKAKGFFQMAKGFTSKAIETTSNLMEKTIPYLKTIEEYEKIQNDKIQPILFIKKDDAESKKFLIKMPIIMKDVWINGVSFKVVDIEELPALSEKFNIEKIPTLIIHELGEEKKRTTDIEEITKYLKDFTI